jgi:hypothetical protein
MDDTQMAIAACSLRSAIFILRAVLRKRRVGIDARTFLIQEQKDVAFVILQTYYFFFLTH